MRVFVTGASGFIGSAVVKELISSGHQVLGLARSDASAKKVAALGAEVLPGKVEDLELLRSGAAQADGIIHTAFNHDDFAANYLASCAADKQAILAMGEVLAGSDRPLVITSGTALMTPGVLATEDTDPPAGSNVLPRVASDEGAAILAEKGIRVSTIRLAPTVHGEGEKGFIPMVIDLARQKGEAAYIGEGLNRWPAIHRLDAARLFVLALEKGEKGAKYHGAAEEGIAIKDIAAVIGRRLGIPVVSKSKEEAAAFFGFLAGFLSLDNPTSSKLTRERLGWNPTQPGLLEDLDHDYYFNA